ncbi:hypothetical protein MtrunA17_Chr2g0334011 [Medicago truncatula]|uniref:Transmembrane protein n=1 Tax=Medicago truncatula TaxID=3880 RepID=G7ZYX4_MEDTR|nr:extensin-1 isoform X2 [Medicago truncatula]AFK43575.1 unknown [Medicago truncatula]KEH39663.1 hypothetical protein MTR_2g105340 [Medicago truncatula]RHN76614.1 hypothetical protein MtrunA17_Chr2g0334011 [Medicago truncatula]
MKTLNYVFLLSSLFAFQVLQTMSLERNVEFLKAAAGIGGRHHAPPPPPHYSPGPVQKLNSPPTPAADVLRHHRHSPPPPPQYNPGPTPGLLILPATSGNPTARKHILYQNSPPNIFAASA